MWVEEENGALRCISVRPFARLSVHTVQVFCLYEYTEKSPASPMAQVGMYDRYVIRRVDGLQVSSRSPARGGTLCTQ